MGEARRSVAGVATDGGRVFVARRLEGGSLGGMWEFPGGKVEDGESDADALRREFLEEFGASVEVGPLVASGGFTHGERLYDLRAYGVALPPRADLRMTEHEEWRWVSPDEIESGALPGGFAPSDLGLLPALREYLAKE